MNTARTNNRKEPRSQPQVGPLSSVIIDATAGLYYAWIMWVYLGTAMNMNEYE